MSWLTAPIAKNNKNKYGNLLYLSKKTKNARPNFESLSKPNLGLSEKTIKVVAK